MKVALPKVANVLGLLSLIGLLLAWVIVLNPLKVAGFIPRRSAVGLLIALAVLSLLASLLGVRAWLVVFVATILSLAFVLLFYHPLV